MRFKCRRGVGGFSLIEVVVVAGIMSVMMFGFMTMQSNQVKSNNYLEFQLQRTQIQGAIIGQVLNDEENCACLFHGAHAFPANPSGAGATLSGVNPTAIGRYHFATPGNCSTATIPAPLVNDHGIDGVKSTFIRLTDIKNISGAYSGNLTLNLQSTKNVLGSKDLPIRIPVTVSISPAGGGNVNFVSCSTQGSTDSNLLTDGPGIGSTVIPRNGTQSGLSFAGVPADAKAVMVAYEIGLSGGGEQDRYCVYKNGTFRIQFGSDSDHEGGQQLTSGVAFLPLSSSGTFRLECENRPNTGVLRVIGIFH